MIRDINEQEIKIGDKCYFPHENKLFFGIVLDIIIEKTEQVNEYGLTFNKIISVKEKTNEFDNFSIPSPKLYIGYDINYLEDFNLNSLKNIIYNKFIVIEPNNVIKCVN